MANTLKKMLGNGAPPLPNWVKLLIIGATIGIAVGVNQASVTTLKTGQDDLREEVKGLRADIREALTMNARITILDARVTANERRLDKMFDSRYRADVR